MDNITKVSVLGKPFEGCDTGRPIGRRIVKVSVLGKPFEGCDKPDKGIYKHSPECPFLESLLRGATRIARDGFV